MRVIDLGWPITEEISVFPGDLRPQIKMKSTVEADGYKSHSLSMSTHNSTHMDAPSHMVADGKNMDELPNEIFFGFAKVIDVSHCAGREIELADVKLSGKEMACVDFLLLKTGWSAKWGTEEYLKDFPVLSKDAAAWIASRDLKGVGLDVVSVDPVTSTDSAIHRILFGGKKDFVIIENMRNLDKVEGNPFCMVALPISLVEQDGGPCRAMAVLE